MVPPMAQIRRPPPPPLDDAHLERSGEFSTEHLLQHYLDTRNLRETVERVENDAKSKLKSIIEQAAADEDPLAHTDEKGSEFLDLVGVVNNPLKDGAEVTQIKREKRISKSLDEDAALELLDTLGLRDQCLMTIQVLDEEAILALNYTGKISDEDLKAMYSETTTWALKV